jgi:hypothetical protein
LYIAPKFATNLINILIFKEIVYLEGVVTHGRASSTLAFGTSNKEGLNPLKTRGLALLAFGDKISYS